MDTLLAQEGNTIKKTSAHTKAREQEKQGVMAPRNNKHHATDARVYPFQVPPYR